MTITDTGIDGGAGGRSWPGGGHGPARRDADGVRVCQLVLRICEQCGYLGQYRSPAFAAFHHPRHSCDKQRRQTVDQAHRTARALTQAAGRRDCPHPHAQHLHGTRAAYVKDRCRCPPCTDANTAAGRTVRRQQQLGTWTPYVPAETARTRLRRLQAAGLGLYRISQLSGVSLSTLHQLLSAGPDGRPQLVNVRPDTARLLLALDPETVRLAPGSHIDARGTRRRLQALIARGWTVGWLAHRLHRHPARLALALTADTVAVRTAHAVRALYDELWDQPPLQRTRAETERAAAASAHARARGWAPPLAWDDIDADAHPATSAPDRALPAPARQAAQADHLAGRTGERAGADDLDEVAIERAVAGDGIGYHQLTLPERAEAVRRLTERGHSLRDIAQQLDTTTRTVSRRRAAQRAA